MRKDNPLFINITTRGFPRGSYLEKKIEQAKAAIEG